MAGRILPVAIATAMGISIGVATFDGEFKAQRRKRLEEEYNREVAAHAALTGEGPKPVAPNSAPPQPSQQVPASPEASQDKTEPPSRWDSLLGLWAWKKNAARERAPAVQKQTPEQIAQQSKP